MAATIPTQIRIEESTKKQAVELLEGLGLNLSDAVNIFLRQVILQKGIPFEIKYWNLNQRLLKLWKKQEELAEIRTLKAIQM